MLQYQYQYEFSKVIIILKIKRMINSNITAMREPHARTATPTATARLGLASDRAYRRFGPKLLRRAVFSSDLAFMSKNEPWLLVFMALGANLKISIFAPPAVRPAYL